MVNAYIVHVVSTLVCLLGTLSISSYNMTEQALHRQVKFTCNHCLLASSSLVVDVHNAEGGKESSGWVSMN